MRSSNGAWIEKCLLQSSWSNHQNGWRKLKQRIRSTPAWEVQNRSGSQRMKPLQHNSNALQVLHQRVHNKFHGRKATAQKMRYSEFQVQVHLTWLSRDSQLKRCFAKTRTLP